MVAWVDLNHRPPLINVAVVGPEPRNTVSLMSLGASFTRADDLASVSSDGSAGRRTQLDVVIDASQTTAWKTYLPPQGLSRNFVQRTVLESSRTENPVDSAALANRRSPQMKFLLEGRCSHQIRDAASCKLSAARKECLSNNCIAKSRS